MYSNMSSGVLSYYFLPYFPIATTEYYNQGIIGTHSSRWLESLTIMKGTMAVGRHEWFWSSIWELTTQSQAWGREQPTLGIIWIFLNPKAYLHWHTSSYEATSPHPSQTVPQTEYQLFKHMGLWEPFSFRPPQETILLLSSFSRIITAGFYTGPMTCLVSNYSDTCAMWDMGSISQSWHWTPTPQN